MILTKFKVKDKEQIKLRYLVQVGPDFHLSFVTTRMGATQIT